MKLYKVSYENNTKFAGSQAQVREIKAEFVEKHGANKKQIEVEDVEIRTDKQGLIEDLNKLLGW